MPREGEQILQSTRSGVASLVSSAAIGKILNFGVNILITRAIGRKVLGTGSLRLDDLLFLGPLVLTRDGLRRAAYRSSTSDVNMQQSLVNLTWLTAPVTVLVASMFAYAMFLSPPSEIVNGDIDVNIEAYHRAMMYTGLAILLAVLTEPVFVLAQSQLLTGIRANIEMLAVFGKCVTMLYLTVYANMDVEAFAIANVVYAFIPLCLYWGHFVVRKQQFPRPKPLPVVVSGGGAVQWCTANMYATAKVFWWQSIQKWLLENGEKIVLVFIGTTTQQGVYVVVDRLGSIIVRLLFQPAEEMSLATLGKLTALRHSHHHRTNSEGERVVPPNKKEITNMVHTNFSGWLLLLMLIGMTLACFGNCYSHLLLHILYGAEWSSTSAPSTLGWYCVYIFFMAMNGICEAFVQGTSTSEGIGRYNRWLVVFSIVYVCSVCGLLPMFGAIGLIMANIIKMLCRISVCTTSYVRPYFREREIKNFKLSSLLPHTSITTCFAGSFVVLQCTLRWLYLPAMAAHAESIISTRSLLVHVVGHVLCGVACLSLTLWLMWKHHGQQLKELLRSRRKEE